MQPVLVPASLSLSDQHGAVLVSRTLGRELREQVEAQAATEDVVVVDFAGIETVSPSFADEFFAKLEPRLLAGGRVRLDNVHPDVSEIIRTVTAGRPNGDSRR